MGFLYHEACPNCGSSDAVGVYDDGGKHCFVCEKTWKDKTQGEKVSAFKDETWQRIEAKMITSPIRGISGTTFSFYNYWKTDDAHVIDHYDLNGNIVAQKCRYKDKTFSWRGNSKEAVPFGLNLWRSGGSRITITEGELDCLSIAEALECKYPVISVNNGAQAARKDLSKYIEEINSYDQIVLWFDNDKAGRAAMQEVANLFPVGKVYTVQCPNFKDANDVIKSQGKKGVLKYYYELKKFAPNGIVGGTSLAFDDVISIDTSTSYMTPYSGINKKMRGVRKGELVTFTAGSGMGKTTAVREIAYDMMMDKKLKVGWVALEENTQRSALGFMSIYLNKTVYMQEERSEASTEDLRKAYEEVIANDRVYFYDHWGSLASDDLLSKLRYLALGAGVDFIFLDHISIVISGGDNGDNERVAIDNLMTSLRSLAEETGVGIIIISHLRRAQGDKGFENGHEVTLSHLRGSGAIAQLSDGVVALERDQQSEEDADIGKVRVLKNRYTGETGLAGLVKYYKETGRLLDYSDDSDEEFSDESDSTDAEF